MTEVMFQKVSRTPTPSPVGTEISLKSTYYRLIVILETLGNVLMKILSIKLIIISVGWGSNMKLRVEIVVKENDFGL